MPSRSTVNRGSRKTSTSSSSHRPRTLGAEDFATPGKIVQLGVAPNRVDLLTTIDGVTFDEAWHGRVSGHYGNEAVDYIGRAELIRNKRASGRPQDLLDIDGLA